MKVGDRVRLTSRCASTFTKIPKHRIDWANRRGTVVRVSTQIWVQWDDRITVDHWPEKALMIIGARSLDTTDPVRSLDTTDSASRTLPATQAASLVGHDSPDGD